MLAGCLSVEQHCITQKDRAKITLARSYLFYSINPQILIGSDKVPVHSR